VFFSRDSLCNSVIPKGLFFLIQDIIHLANSLNHVFDFIIHWIPSHIFELSCHRHQIVGNDCADELANMARESQAGVNRFCEHNIDSIRNRILNDAAHLTWSIYDLLKRNTSPPPDGPSSDDFSLANANQIISSGNTL